MDCQTAEAYDNNVKKVYENFAAYPEYVKFFKKYFNDPASITRYHTMSIRGSLGTISSAAGEQCHASNELVLTTKIIGIVLPEHQMLALLKRSDNWICRDLEERTKNELEQHGLTADHPPGSPVHDALMALYHKPFK